ncbi:gem-associated protein 6-like isoform X1 [Haemaphysalis longicornis]
MEVGANADSDQAEGPSSSGEGSSKQADACELDGDPLLLLSYVHKLVRVETVDGMVLAGYVKTVDPISDSVVLVMLDDGRPSTVHVVLGHAVKSVTVVSDASPEEKELLEQLFVPKCDELSSEQLQERKEKLRSWLSSKRIPVSESEGEPGVLVIAGSVRFMPPYGPENFHCANSLVLDRMRGIVSQMPGNEFWPKLDEPTK